MADFSNADYRKMIIDETKSDENLQRKSESFKQQEIYRDRMHRWVETYLRGQFSKSSVDEMPIISSVNLAKRITNQQASLYRKPPERTFTNLTEDQELVVRKIYEAMNANVMLKKSNRNYVLQNQNLIMVVPKDGKITMRSIMQHQYDAIPDGYNPEYAHAYLLSVYDRSQDRMGGVSDSKLSAPTGFRANRHSPLQDSGYNSAIADRSDYQAMLEKYLVWSPELNFFMNGKGQILSEDVENPIAPHLPFIDVHGDKDFEYYTRMGQAVTDFCVQYNAALSDIANVVRMQGWGQAVVKGPQGMKKEAIQIGINHILYLETPQGEDQQVDFSYVSPSPDLKGSLGYLETLLMNFITSRGLDPKDVTGSTGGKSFSSGVERLLAMIDKFEATSDDIDVFQSVERQLYELVKIWHNRLRGTDLLIPELQTTELPADSKVFVKYAKPELITTDSEKLDNALKKMELGIASREKILMELEGVDEEEAEKIIQEIDQREMSNFGRNQLQDQE